MLSFSRSGPGFGAGLAAAVCLHLHPAATNRQRTPPARVIPGSVVEHPLASVTFTSFEALPGAIGLCGKQSNQDVTSNGEDALGRMGKLESSLLIELSMQRNALRHPLQCDKRFASYSTLSLGWFPWARCWQVSSKPGLGCAQRWYVVGWAPCSRPSGSWYLPSLKCVRLLMPRSFLTIRRCAWKRLKGALGMRGSAGASRMRQNPKIQYIADGLMTGASYTSW